MTIKLAKSINELTNHCCLGKQLFKKNCFAFNALQVFGKLLALNPQVPFRMTHL